jgi:hypothetical protein
MYGDCEVPDGVRKPKQADGTEYFRRRVLVMYNKEACKRYRENNRKARAESQKRYELKNIEKIKNYRSEYYLEHKDEKAEYTHNYYLKNKDVRTKQISEWRLKNLKRIQERRNKNKEKRNKQEKLRRETDVNYKLTSILRNRLRNALIGVGTKLKRTLELLGCSVEFLKKHLESQFKEGMNWDNYGLYGWHVDHIKTCYSFDLSKPKQQRECFHYSNLRPLWAKDNLSRPKCSTK